MNVEFNGMSKEGSICRTNPVCTAAFGNLVCHKKGININQKGDWKGDVKNLGYFFCLSEI